MSWSTALILSMAFIMLLDFHRVMCLNGSLDPVPAALQILPHAPTRISACGKFLFLGVPLFVLFVIASLWVLYTGAMHFPEAIFVPLAPFLCFQWLSIRTIRSLSKGKA